MFGCSDYFKLIANCDGPTILLSKFDTLNFEEIIPTITFNLGVAKSIQW